MIYTQLVSPDLTVKGQIGYCLQYVGDAFHTTSVAPYAWNAWQETQFKHTDPLPTDVSVPIWFTFVNNGINEGHVAINVPGVGIYSSPWQAGTSYAVLQSVQQLIYIYSDGGIKQMAYVGWSEDVLNVRVVEGETMDSPIIDSNWLHALLAGMLNVNESAGNAEFDALATMTEHEVLGRIIADARFPAMLAARDQAEAAVPTVIINGTTYVPQGS